MKENDPSHSNNAIMVLPHCSVIANDRAMPAVIRLVAAGIAEEPYTTVGAVLSNMATKDLTNLLLGWIRTVTLNRDDDAEEGGAIRMEINTDDSAIFLIFTMMVSRAQDGELKADPHLGGLKAELMASFIDAFLLTRRDSTVFLDLTKLSLDPEFLEQDLNQVISSQNFKALKSINTVKSMWAKLKKSESMKLLKEGSQPKVDLSPSTLTKGIFKVKKKKTSLGDGIEEISQRAALLQKMADNGADLEVDPIEEEKPVKAKAQKAAPGGSLADFEAKLRRQLGED